MTRLKEGESRTYTIPLRRDFLKTPKWRRSKRAIYTIRNFLVRHTKTENIKVGRWLNEEVWKHGGKNPPSKIKVDAKKEKEFVSVELAELSPRAKRIMEAESKKEKDSKEEKKKEKQLEEEKPKKEYKKPVKKAKQEEKGSKRELQKKLDAAKKAEEKRKLKKQKQAPTRQQDIKMSKK